MDRWSPFRLGARRALPLGLAGLPFGLVYGVAVGESEVAGWIGVLGSWLVLAGAAQLTLLDLLDGDAAFIVVVATPLLINARFAFYSAALAPGLRSFPAPWRYGLPYLMTDQAAMLSIAYFDEAPDAGARRWFALGAGLCFATGWWIGTVIGWGAGAALPESLDIDFAIPAMFIALLVPAVRDRPALIAALASGATAVAAAGLPSGANVLVAAVVGLAVGRVVSSEASS